MTRWFGKNNQVLYYSLTRNISFHSELGRACLFSPWHILFPVERLGCCFSERLSGSHNFVRLLFLRLQLPATHSPLLVGQRLQKKKWSFLGDYKNHMQGLNHKGKREILPQKIKALIRPLYSDSCKSSSQIRTGLKEENVIKTYHRYEGRSFNMLGSLQLNKKIANIHVEKNIMNKQFINEEIQTSKKHQNTI